MMTVNNVMCFYISIYNKLSQSDRLFKLIKCYFYRMVDIQLQYWRM